MLIKYIISGTGFIIGLCVSGSEGPHWILFFVAAALMAAGMLIGILERRD